MQANIDIWPLFHLITYHANIRWIEFFVKSCMWFYMCTCAYAHKLEKQLPFLKRTGRRRGRFWTFDLGRSRLCKLIPYRIESLQGELQKQASVLETFLSSQVSFLRYPTLLLCLGLQLILKLSLIVKKTFQQKYAWTFKPVRNTNKVNRINVKIDRFTIYGILRITDCLMLKWSSF